MVGQQRNILAAMGVDVWIPRHHVAQKNTAASIWRDQMPEQQLAIPKHVDVAVNIPETKSLPVLEPVQEQPVHVEITAQHTVPQQPKVLLELEALVECDAFQLEAYCFQDKVLVIDATGLTEAEIQLWSNIQAAMPGEYAELSWPFPRLDFRDSRGVQAYVQGFLDAIAIDKKVLCLGKLKFLTHTDCMYLASLSEMLEKPIFKKRLWTLMQSS